MTLQLFHRLYAGSALLPRLPQTQFGYEATLSGKLVRYIQARYMPANDPHAKGDPEAAAH